MKKTAARFAIALLLTFVFCFTIYVSAETSSSKQYKIADAVQLAKFLTAQTTSISKDFDLNSDKKIDATDLTLIKRLILYNEAPISSETSTTTSNTETTSNSTESTTTTTTSLQDYIICEQINKVAVTDTDIPIYKEEYYEVKDAVYIFKHGNTTYAYTILSTLNQTPLSTLIDNYNVEGAHIWVYHGKKEPCSINDPLPDTTGLQFNITYPSYDQTDFDYSLAEYKKIRGLDIKLVAQAVAGGTLQDPKKIARFDYNLSGRLDEEDVEIMIKYYTSNIYNFFSRTYEKGFYRYLDNMEALDHTNVALLNHNFDFPVLYSYQVPTADLHIDSTYKAATVPVQTIPDFSSNGLMKYPELEDISDSQADYYAWDYTQSAWAKVSNSSDNWEWGAGFLVYVLTNKGYYFQGWIHK